MKVQSIKISNIQVKHNVRTDTTDVGQLMDSIKQHTMLHPIGVWKENKKYVLAYGNRRLAACKKLGYTMIDARILDKKLSTHEFLSINTVENIHRNKINAAELSRVCGMLRKEGLSNGEIASTLSLSKGKVKMFVELYRKIPKGFEDIIGFQEGKNRKGKIPPNVACRILMMRTTNANILKVLKIARLNELSTLQVGLIEKFILSGSTVENAMRLLDDYQIKHLHLVVNKTEAKKINEPFARYVARIVKRHNDTLVYLKEDK